MRLCVDYRELKKKIHPGRTAFPLEYRRTPRKISVHKIEVNSEVNSDQND